jgi:hypothetical protein
MKTLIAILSFFPLALAAAPPPPPFVHVHKGAISVFGANSNSVAVKVTARCTGGLGDLNGVVHVHLMQAGGQSNADALAVGDGSSTVECDDTVRTIAVSLGGQPNINLGKATVSMITLKIGVTTVATESDHDIVIGFPVIEHMEQEEGGND